MLFKNSTLILYNKKIIKDDDCHLWLKEEKVLLIPFEMRIKCHVMEYKTAEILSDFSK